MLRSFDKLDKNLGARASIIIKEKNGASYNRKEEIKVTVHEVTKSARCWIPLLEHASQLVAAAHERNNTRLINIFDVKDKATLMFEIGFSSLNINRVYLNQTICR